MVAIAGAGWRLAPSLVALIEETDKRYPSRSIASDGSIGDSSHLARRSDHNPSSGWVCAVDLTDDKVHGCDADHLARHLIISRDPRVKYVIWNGQIAQAVKGWRVEKYTGSNSHYQHTHISIFNTATARNDLSPWWPPKHAAPKPPVLPTSSEDDMPLIIKAEGLPARLFDPPVFVPLDSASAAALKLAGVKEAAVTPADYQEIRDQILKALD